LFIGLNTWLANGGGIMNYFRNMNGIEYEKSAELIMLAHRRRY